MDPHTACGFKDLDPDRPSVVLATASPAKFPETIRAAIGIEPTHPSLEALKGLPIVKFPVKANVPRCGSSYPPGLSKITARGMRPNRLLKNYGVIPFE